MPRRMKEITYCSCGSQRLPNDGRCPECDLPVTFGDQTERIRIFELKIQRNVPTQCSRCSRESEFGVFRIVGFICSCCELGEMIAEKEALAAASGFPQWPDELPKDYRMTTA